MGRPVAIAIRESATDTRGEERSLMRRFDEVTNLAFESTSLDDTVFSQDGAHLIGTVSADVARVTAERLQKLYDDGGDDDEMFEAGVKFHLISELERYLNAKSASVKAELKWAVDDFVIVDDEPFAYDDDPVSHAEASLRYTDRVTLELGFDTSQNHDYSLDDLDTVLSAIYSEPVDHRSIRFKSGKLVVRGAINTTDMTDALRDQVLALDVISPEALNDSIAISIGVATFIQERVARSGFPLAPFGYLFL